MSIEMTITNDTKFSEFLTYTKNNFNKKGLCGVYDWYHSKYIKTGRFAPIIHSLAQQQQQQHH
ncbi:hypothetical protein PPL_04551 [Heterostelium album PN500]|uniref:Uncharacterized protein n=1 Tax=Heterostelium pallidum (strain ATCC 26659 / Pp 5 / PN500) TaxID=670386 RepID=D3B7W3_HETP5|nr:hypothetical protein PPL_04551 [Heterostelium album PN500]EFA82856.1 hypothetical protein PPL_04551 [Heterostelium album PN500]|eukprot:XP_020434973.1 hypothetical protein PPL_04551 [Heterostelium album PN500]